MAVVKGRVRTLAIELAVKIARKARSPEQYSEEIKEAISALVDCVSLGSGKIMQDYMQNRGKR